MNTLTLLIIESHTAVRQALATRLSCAKGIQEVKTAATVAEAMEEAASYKPDVILLGVRHPLIDELKYLVSQVRQLANMGRAVIILASYFDEIEREVLLQAGAKQYLLKTIDTPRLLQAIEKVAGGTQTAVSLTPLPPSFHLPQLSL